MSDDELVAVAEGAAEAFHQETGIGLPIRPLIVAWACDATIIPTPGSRRSACVGAARQIFVDLRLPAYELGFVVLHECAHLLRRDADQELTDPAAEERGCDLTAVAMAAPARAVRGVVREHGFDLVALRTAFGPHVSADLVARRVVDCYPNMRAWMLEAGRVRTRAYRRAIGRDRRALSVLEREAAEGAERGAITRPHPNCVPARSWKPSWPMTTPALNRREDRGSGSTPIRA